MTPIRKNSAHKNHLWPVCTQINPSRDFRNGPGQAGSWELTGFAFVPHTCLLRHLPCQTWGKKENKQVDYNNIQLNQQSVSPSYLPAENISEFGSAFAIVGFLLCETEQLATFAHEQERWLKSSRPTFWRDKYLVDKIGRERSHFAVFHAHPPSIFDLWRKPKTAQKKPTQPKGSSALSLYLSDDLYDFPNVQLQLVMVHGVVGKFHLTFPRLWHFFYCKHRSHQECGGEQMWDTSGLLHFPVHATFNLPVFLRLRGSLLLSPIK